MDNPIFCAETNRQETKHESVNNITLFIFVQNRKKILNHPVRGGVLAVRNPFRRKGDGVDADTRSDHRSLSAGQQRFGHRARRLFVLRAGDR